MIRVHTLDDLYNLNSSTINDRDEVYVQGFREPYDGGGGKFIFDKDATIDPVFSTGGLIEVGYNANYDGMICKGANIEEGRWIRHWDRGQLNLRWFGAMPGDIETSPDGRENCSKALNAALEYAQFRISGNSSSIVPGSNPIAYDPPLTIFNFVRLTRPAKTIFVPSGNYYFRSSVSTITYGVVIQGEGSIGSDSQGTRFMVAYEYTDEEEERIEIPRNIYGFLRYNANAAENSGAGLKDLVIEVIGTETSSFNANVIVLLSPDTIVPSDLVPPPPNAVSYNPAVAKWGGENVVVKMNNRATRAMFLKCNQEGGVFPWRIRDPQIRNCWFSGGTIPRETIRGENVSGFHLIGGALSSGNSTEAAGITLSGQYGCANTHLSGIDLTNAVIKADKKSRFVNVDCSYGQLLVENTGVNDDPLALHVSKRHILNRRKLFPPTLSCITSTSLPASFDCYNDSVDIAGDASWD